MKCSRNTAAWELRRAYGQDSCSENHDKCYPRLEKSSWQQAGADAQTDLTWLTTSTAEEVLHLPINTRGLAASPTHRLLLCESLWAPKLVRDSYHKTEPPWPREYHIKAVQITAVAAQRPVSSTPRRRVRSEGDGRLVYTSPTAAGPSLQH